MTCLIERVACGSSQMRLYMSSPMLSSLCCTIDYFNVGFGVVEMMEEERVQNSNEDALQQIDMETRLAGSGPPFRRPWGRLTCVHPSPRRASTRLVHRLVCIPTSLLRTVEQIIYKVIVLAIIVSAQHVHKVLQIVGQSQTLPSKCHRQAPSKPSASLSLLVPVVIHRD